MSDDIGIRRQICVVRNALKNQLEADQRDGIYEHQLFVDELRAILATLEQVRTRPKLTATPPTEPGWYWYLDPKYQIPSAYYVCWCSNNVDLSCDVGIVRKLPGKWCKAEVPEVE